MTRDDMLAGMRQALGQEARAARTFAAKAPRGRAARNAKLTLCLNDERLYTVALDHRWQQPEDTLVRIALPDRDPIEAYVEYVEESGGPTDSSRRMSNLVVSTESALPRQLPTGTRVEPAPDLLHRRLLEALEHPTEGQRRLASKAFGLAPVEDPCVEATSRDANVEISGFQPDQAQHRALEMAQTHEVLYVIGPPGTGKTVTLAAMAYRFMRQGMTVLIAAQTNIAVDNAIEQLATLCDQSQDQAPLKPGLIIRLGQSHLASVRRRKDFNLPALATDYLLAKVRASLNSSQQEQAQLEESKAQLKLALEKQRKSLTDLQAAARSAQKMNPLARALARISLKRLMAALAELEAEVAGLQKKHDVCHLQRSEVEASISDATAKLGALERRAHSLAKARESADGVLSIAEGEIAPQLAREVFDEERCVLGAARVVGATLTKTYVSKALKDGNVPRRFDAVIVDEVSMASLPALYVAAARADRRVVFVGDPRQLPPIVKSRREVESAQKWLARDIFEHVGITLEDAHAGRRHSALLDEQRRMHPAISRVPSHLIYDDLLLDHPSASAIPSALEPLPDHPLVLCDTSQASPQCSKPRSSRLNAYHATCAFVLGQRALQSLKRTATGSSSREGFMVGLIAPYRRQADLLQSMIKKQGLQHEMWAGTVHRFQGLECDVVVYDTVESDSLEPTSFTADDRTGQARRLINVALTRARRKLIIVANRRYLEQHMAAAQGTPAGASTRQDEHTLLKVIHAVPDDAVVDSLQFVKTAESELPRTVRTGSSDDIDQALQLDLQRARHSVLIVSPFVTNGRTSAILDMLRPTLDRKATVHVVTRPSSAMPKDIVSGEALALLQENGVVCHTGDPNLHEKLVFIDKTVVYVGSMNALSFGGATQEVMVRVTDAKIVRELRAPYEQFLPHTS